MKVTTTKNVYKIYNPGKLEIRDFYPIRYSYEPLVYTGASPKVLYLHLKTVFLLESTDCFFT